MGSRCLIEDGHGDNRPAKQERSHGHLQNWSKRHITTGLHFVKILIVGIGQIYPTEASLAAQTARLSRTELIIDLIDPIHPSDNHEAGVQYQ